MRKYLVKLLGGQMECELYHTFTDDDAIERIKNIEDTQKKYEILTLAVKKLFNTVNSDDILRQTSTGEWFCEGKSLTQLEVNSLKREAVSILNTRFFTVLDKEVKYHTNRRMREATTILELEGAKCLEFVWDILKTRLKAMKSVKTTSEV